MLSNPFALEFGVRNILRMTQYALTESQIMCSSERHNSPKTTLADQRRHFFPHTIQISSVLYKHSIRLKWLLHSLVAEFSDDIVYSGFHWVCKWFNSLKHLVPEGHLCKAMNSTRITLSLSPCDGSKADMWTAFPQRLANP